MLGCSSLPVNWASRKNSSRIRSSVPSLCRLDCSPSVAGGIWKRFENFNRDATIQGYLQRAVNNPKASRTEFFAKLVIAQFAVGGRLPRRTSRGLRNCCCCRRPMDKTYRKSQAFVDAPADPRNPTRRPSRFDRWSPRPLRRVWRPRYR